MFQWPAFDYLVRFGMVDEGEEHDITFGTLEAGGVTDLDAACLNAGRPEHVEKASP